MRALTAHVLRATILAVCGLLLIQDTSRLEAQGKRRRPPPKRDHPTVQQVHKALGTSVPTVATTVPTGELKSLERGYPASARRLAEKAALERGLRFDNPDEAVRLTLGGLKSSGVAGKSVLLPGTKGPSARNVFKDWDKSIQKEYVLVGPGPKEPVPRPDTSHPEDKKQPPKLETGASIREKHEAGLIDDDQFGVLMALARPALLVWEDQLDDRIPPSWFKQLNPPPRPDAMRQSLMRTGVLWAEPGLGPAQRQVLGTGFLVGHNNERKTGILMTNYHVALAFIQPDLSLGKSRGDAALNISVNFGHYHRNDVLRSFAVKDALFWEEALDCALLEIEDPEGALPTPLGLMRKAPSTLDRVVYVNGYPVDDEDAFHPTPRRVIYQVIGAKPGVKRLAPGKLMPDSDQALLYHDCTTLSGNSGSPLIDLETGEVLGLHRAGLYLVGNEAVPMWRILANEKVAEILKN
jgi:glutamyl endopeptidase